VVSLQNAPADTDTSETEASSHSTYDVGDENGVGAASFSAAAQAPEQVDAPLSSRSATVTHDGDDYYDGGEGSDTIDISATAADATINLSAGFATSDEIGHDKLSNIENAVGGSGDDTIVDSKAHNEMEAVRAKIPSSSWMPPTPRQTLSNGTASKTSRWETKSTSVISMATKAMRSINSSSG
jgi:hypothetical protein